MPGGGRPKGSPNKGRAEFVSLIHKRYKGPEKLLDKLDILINGVKCSKAVGEGVVVYEKPPDGESIRYLLDQAYGKAKQSMELEHKVRTIEDDLDDLPEE